MAKLRVMKKEVTILAERNGHGLFIWQHRRAGNPTYLGARLQEGVDEKVKTLCALCGEEFTITGTHGCYLHGPVNHRCTAKGGN